MWMKAGRSLINLDNIVRLSKRKNSNDLLLEYSTFYDSDLIESGTYMISFKGAKEIDEAYDHLFDCFSRKDYICILDRWIND
jgi:hypothetical protein